jgi:hypothetical protein
MESQEDNSSINSKKISENSNNQLKDSDNEQ